MHNREEILKRLFIRTTQGIKFGLDRITEAAECINNPQNAYQSIHVAGTNGKGSVCAFLESLLRRQGFSTGMFTSPHIVRFEERFIINGKPVTTQEWLDVYLDIEDSVTHYSLTFFEISALIAFEIFKRKNIDWAIIETGMGGRLDATNIIIPEASVITNIGFDHTEYLGSDIISITKEKLGIVKENVPVILAEQQYQEVVEMAGNFLQEREIEYYYVNKDEAEYIKPIDTGSSFKYRNTEIEVPFHGNYQIMNALCAIKTVEHLDLVDEELLSKAIGTSFLPARFQICDIKGKKAVFDVAHNPQATGELCKLIKQRFGNTSVCIVTGIMADKDAQFMFSRYAECADSIIVTQPKTSRAAQIDDLAEKIPLDFKDKFEMNSNVENGVKSAFEKNEEVVCITGSFYTVGEALTVLEIDLYNM